MTDNIPFAAAQFVEIFSRLWRRHIVLLAGFLPVVLPFAAGISVMPNIYTALDTVMTDPWGHNVTDIKPDVGCYLSYGENGTWQAQSGITATETALRAREPAGGLALVGFPVAKRLLIAGVILSQRLGQAGLVSDALVIASIFTYTVFVIRLSGAKRQAINYAVDRVVRVGGIILGAVLNVVDISKFAKMNRTDAHFLRERSCHQYLRGKSA